LLVVDFEIYSFFLLFILSIILRIHTKIFLCKVPIEKRCLLFVPLGGVLGLIAEFTLIDPLLSLVLFNFSLKILKLTFKKHTIAQHTRKSHSFQSGSHLPWLCGSSTRKKIAKCSTTSAKTKNTRLRFW
jgi:hypothetical protein